MSKLVGQHQQSAFTSPSNGDRPIDATVVKGNDNDLVTIHNAHDNNATVHVQSGATADKPAAGTVGRLFYDTTIGRLEYDTGTAWVTQNFASGTAAARPAATSVPSGYVYFVTDTGLFSYSDGATWSTLSPSSGPSGTGTTSHLAKWSDATTLSAGEIYQATVIGRDFWFLSTGGYTDPLLFYDGGRPASTGQFIRLHSTAATAPNTHYTYPGFESCYAGYGSACYAQNAVINQGVQCYQAGTTTAAVQLIALPATYTPTDRKPCRDNGMFVHTHFRVSSGASANTIEYIAVGFSNNIYDFGIFSTAGNTHTLPNANTYLSAVVQMDATGGQWRLVTSDGTNAVYDQYQITTSGATAAADDDEFDIWFGVDAGTTTYRWKIVRNGTTISESSYNASSMRNPTSSTYMYGGISFSRSTAATAEWVRINEFLFGVDV